MNTPKYTPKDINRFWIKVAITVDEDLCWNWIAGCFNEGYGQFSYKGIPTRLKLCAVIEKKLTQKHVWQW